MIGLIATVVRPAAAVSDAQLAAALSDGGVVPLGHWRIDGDRTTAILGRSFAAGSVVLLCFDPWPEPPRLRHRLSYHGLDNVRAIRVFKRLARTLRLGKRDSVWVTRNSTAAHAVLRQAGLDGRSIAAAVDAIVQAVELDHHALAPIASARLRARLDLVQLGGTTVVRKTYLPHVAEFARRECDGRRALAGRVPAVDGVVAQGANWFCLPVYRAPSLPGPNHWRLVPLDHARHAVAVARQLYEAGYAMLDCNPHAILYADDGTPRLVDLEYLHKYEVRPASFEDSWDITGPPAGCDVPGSHIAGSFTQRWRPWIGVTYDELMTAPPAVLARKRFFFVLRNRLPRLLFVVLRDGIRMLRDIALGMADRLRGGSRFLRN